MVRHPLVLGQGDLLALLSLMPSLLEKSTRQEVTHSLPMFLYSFSSLWAFVNVVLVMQVLLIFKFTKFLTTSNFKLKFQN